MGAGGRLALRDERRLWPLSSLPFGAHSTAGFPEALARLALAVVPLTPTR
jgi:hypothetical protein